MSGYICIIEKLWFSVTSKTRQNQPMPSYHANDSVQLRNTFSDNLRAVMQKKGVSQADVAKHLRCSRNTINLYVKGRSLPSPKNLNDLAHYFEVPAAELLPTTGHGTSIPAVNMKLLADGQAFLQINQAMPFSLASELIAVLNKGMEEAAVKPKASASPASKKSKPKK